MKTPWFSWKIMHRQLVFRLLLLFQQLQSIPLFTSTLPEDQTVLTVRSSPHLAGRFFKRQFPAISLSRKFPVTSCGLCAQKCPADAIPPDNCKTTDKTKCISCMRCVSLCPVHAREVNPVMTAVAAKILKKSCTQEKANELFL